jgi:hypothetical protein
MDAVRFEPRLRLHLDPVYLIVAPIRIVVEKNQVFYRGCNREVADLVYRAVPPPLLFRQIFFHIHGIMGQHIGPFAKLYEGVE